MPLGKKIRTKTPISDKVGERVGMKRAGALPRAKDAGDRKLLSDVKKLGWHVVKVPEQAGTPSWAFTVGLYETFGQPEVIILGLPLETMHALLNNVGELARRGLKLRDKLRSTGVIKGLPCEFRTVERRWYGPLLGYMSWFYAGELPAVLQCTWPDREGHLLSNARFDKRMRRMQPALWEPTARRARMVEILRTLDE